MGGGKRSLKVAPRRQKVKVNHPENSGLDKKGESESRLGPKEHRRSRKDRVHPESHSRQSGSASGKAMVGNGVGSDKHRPKNKPSLAIQTEDEARQYDPSSESPSNLRGVRGSRDLRSPGVQSTPTGAQAAKMPEKSGFVPDFITQTDASGRATTPRSAQAIEGARKSHPSGPKPTLHVDKNGRLSEDEDEDDDVSRDMVEETCSSIVDSIRFLCCCMSPADPTSKIVSAKDTMDSDDKSRLKLLDPHHPDDAGKKCLVLDLDETLVHSSFRAVPGADFVIPVQIEEVVHFVYVAKRPGVDEFLIEMAKHYEIVIYTASLNKYADPLLDLLDPHNVIRARLFRESCVFYEGNYVKDLSLLDRDLSHTIIIDNSPSSYMFHPENAIDCSSFIDDPRDRELEQIGAFLTGIKDVKDVRGITMKWRDWPALEVIEEHPEKTC